ncbi:MAG: UDP-glucose 4-epimerase GalE [Bacteroidales bacterium]|nr:UDP-glucose 4-epimerase GalE [Bacteroidales bacterium]
MNKNKSTILVTGGLGYIGSHTVIELIQHGFDVVILDNLSNSSIEVLDLLYEITGKNIPFYKLDLSQDDLSILPENIDGIIHFAAFKNVFESVEYPLLYYQNNVDAIFRLLNWMQSRNIKKFIFSSSCTVYGEVKELPVREETPFNFPLSPYAHTKQIGEITLQYFIRSYPSQVISLRYFNPAGAHPSGKIGEIHYKVPQNLFPYITQTAYGIRPKLYIYGGDYPTPDGTPIRDYIHVIDVARAHVLAYEYLDQLPLPSYEVFNIGSGKGYSVLQVVQAFEKSTGIRVPYEITHRRPGDAAMIYADTSKVQKVLNFKPIYTLEDMAFDAWKWEQYFREKIKKNE